MLNSDKKIQAKKDAATKEKTAADAAGMSTVGPDGKDTKSELAAKESIQKNLASQSSSTPAGSGRAAGTMGCFQSNSYGGTSFVDATTAYNNSNDDVNVYLRFALSQSLSAYNLCDKDGHILKCISLARYISTSCSNNDNNIIPDSGATLTMRKHQRDFEDDYQACSDVFVLMGDGSRIPIHGYGTSRMKINGNVTRVLNSLHVLGLDSNLFSVTKHGRMDHGHSFLLEGGNMHLSFPKFSITQPIPENDDLRIALQPMTVDDWSIPNYILDGDNCSDDYSNNYKNRINILNGIAKGCAVTTRANRKLQVDTLKKVLGLNHVYNTDSSSNRDFDVTRKSSFADNNNNSSSSDPTKGHNSDISSFSDSTKGLPGKKSLPDKYFYEGSPDKLMMEALKELNTNDIKDFLMDSSPAKTEQFEKEKRAPPSQYHLESSRGDVKDQLTSYQLQSYFGDCHLKDFGLLSKLGTGLSVIDSDQDISTIGELVNQKR